MTTMHSYPSPSLTHSHSTDPEPFFPHPPPPEPSENGWGDSSEVNERKRKATSSISNSTSSTGKPKQRLMMKSHVCPTCNSTFSRLFNLNQHVLIHTNNREFECLEEGCTKVFLRSTDLTRHCKHVHRVDTKKDKRYSIQKKRLSDKNKQQSATTTSSSSNHNRPPPPPPLSPSFSSTSSDNTSSTQASSYSTYSTSALDQPHASDKLAPESTFPRNSVPGDHSDNESMELDTRDDYPRRNLPYFETTRQIDSSPFSLPPIGAPFGSAASQPQSAHGPRPRSIILPPLNSTHSTYNPSSSPGLGHSFPSILSGPSQISSLANRSYPTPPTTSKTENGGPLTPTLPSIRTQLSFSFNGPPPPPATPNFNASSGLSNSRTTQVFDGPLPPIRTSPSMP